MKAKVLKVKVSGTYAMRQCCDHEIATLSNGHTLERLVWSDCANRWGIDGTSGNAHIGNRPLKAGDEVEYSEDAKAEQ